MADFSGNYRNQSLPWLEAHEIEIRNALSAITNSQSYALQGRQVTYANYDELFSKLGAVRVEIERQKAIANGNPDPTTASRVVYINFGNA